VYRVFESLDALVTVVEEARGLPMTSNCVVPRGDLLDLLDDLREAVPAELDDAQDVLDRRDALIHEAQQRAEETVSAATAEAERLLAEAREQAEQLLAEARHDAERTVADGRQEYTELVDRAQAESERLAEAGRVAHERSVAEGRDEQARLVSETEVVRAARLQAAGIVDAATSESARVRTECDAYVDRKLGEFEDVLGKALRTVNRGRSQLWRTSPATAASGTGMDLID
jgi:cell division septum initiation protein DivIVA